MVVAIDDVIEKKVEALVGMESQFVEGGANGPVPERRRAAGMPGKRVAERFRSQAASVANRHRDKLIELYGEEQGKKVRYAEAFEVCEYGRRPSPADLRRLFPMLPAEK